MEFSKLLKKVDELPALYKNDIRAGDQVRIKTQNSTYRLTVLEDNTYMVEGGRFDLKEVSPLQLGITGCGLGGAFVKTDLVAACGLNIEFENRVITSTVVSFAVFRNEHLN